MSHKSADHFVRSLALATIFAFLFQCTGVPLARAYVRDFTVPAAGGCPQPQHQNIAIGAVPLARQWSTSLPNINPAAIVTTAAQGTPTQLDEIEATIQQAYAIWAGVSGTLANASSFPNALGPLGRTATQSACSPDPVNGVQTGVDGVNTICFNQNSAAFTTGVLSLTSEELSSMQVPAQELEDTYFGDISQFLQHCTERRFAEFKGWKVDEMAKKLKPILSAFSKSFPSQPQPHKK